MPNRHLGTPLALALLLAAAPALAQPAAPDAAADENPSDIIVTAKSRAERLQDVPLSISAFTTSDLTDAQVRDIRDLQKITPNLSIFGGGGRNDPTAYAIRGLTSNTSDERYQGISFFLDGIALSGQLASFDTDNIERVEVIKGPQAATFGRATYSGAINFITKDPSADTPTGFVRVRGSLNKSSSDHNFYFGASFTVPVVSQKLWLQASTTLYKTGAMARATDTRQPVGREKTQIATATLFFKPNDTLTIKLRGLYTHDRDTVPAQTVQHPRDWVRAGVPLRASERGGGAFLPTYVPDPDVDQIGSKDATGTTRDRYFVSLVATQMIGDYELSYRGGYFRNKDYRYLTSVPRATGPGQDPVFGPLIGTGAVTVTALGASSSIGVEYFENTSHQLVLLSPSDQPFRFRIGGYYFWENDETQFRLNRTAANPLGKLNEQNFKNIAGFGGFDWDIIDSLTLSGEARYARETLTYKPCPVCVSPIATGRKQSSNDFTPRVTLNFKATPDNILYGLYSRGVKSGRFSYLGANALTGAPPQIFYAEPEKLDNFEVGSKNAFFDRRLIFNAAGFIQNVKNQQLVSTITFVGIGGTQNITVANNVGKSRIYGFELESVAKVTPQFTLRGSVGYAHQEFTNKNAVLLQPTSVVTFPGAYNAAVVLDGKTQGNVPRWNGVIAAEYTVPGVLDDKELSFRVDGNYRGKFFADLGNRVIVKDSWTVNGRINLGGDRFDIALFGRNILNNQRATGSGLAGATTACGFNENNTAFYGPVPNANPAAGPLTSGQQCLFASLPRPAEVGVEAVFRF